MGCSFVIRYISGPQLLFEKKLEISRNCCGPTCQLSKQFISLKNANKKLKYGRHSTALNLLYFCMFSMSAWVNNIVSTFETNHFYRIHFCHKTYTLYIFQVILLAWYPLVSREVSSGSSAFSGEASYLPQDGITLLVQNRG